MISPGEAAERGGARLKDMNPSPHGTAAVRQPPPTTGSVTPQPPGRTPHGASLRASGTAQPQVPLQCPGGETLQVRGASPRTPVPPEARDAPQGRPPAREAEVISAVTALYEAHALGMIRLAHIMLGDRQSAEDVVQEAFCGLYRRWSHLSDQGSAVHYLRSAVLNHCRSVLRRRTTSQAPREMTSHPGAERSAESAVLTREERDEIMRAVRRLPPRQREALVLRFYLDLSAEETATTMGISPSSVRSATHRALASLGRMLQEQS
jgi:RNA polymerase sigma-70 factor (sigma-E family)